MRRQCLFRIVGLVHLVLSQKTWSSNLPRGAKLTKKRNLDIIQDMKLKFDKVKTLKASECLSGTWMLEGSYYKTKNVYSHNSFDLIAEFSTLEECKMFSDLNLPDVKFHVVSYQDWLSHYWSC